MAFSMTICSDPVFKQLHFLPSPWWMFLFQLKPKHSFNTDVVYEVRSMASRHRSDFNPSHL